MPTSERFSTTFCKSRCRASDENLDFQLEMDGYYLGGIYVASYEREPKRLPWPDELQPAFRSRPTG